MAFDDKKAGLEVDIVLPPAKRKSGAAAPGDGPLDEAAGDDVQGELYAKRFAAAASSGKPAAILAAFKSLYEHCRDSAETEPAEPEEEATGGGLFGAGGPGSEY